jgi:hypothetical protein
MVEYACPSGRVLRFEICLRCGIADVLPAMESGGIIRKSDWMVFG